jgi:hypothetical protein
MHDPKAVALSIPRPFPKRWKSDDGKGRLQFRHSWAKWYDLRPRVFRKFTVIFGKGFYWPDLITIWHNEPGGHDFGEVCRQRKQDRNGKWYYTRTWRWHVHHWSLQIHPWQHFRRWALTRCEWCGDRSVKRDPVNISHQWHRDPGPWWRGERGLFHHDCSSIRTAHQVCLCEVGPWEHGLSGQPYGRCANCGKYRGWRKEPNPLGDDAQRILASIPDGQRDASKVAASRELWAQARADEETRK